jgi:hypothetical protein
MEMNSRWRRGDNDPWGGIFALLALLALLGTSRGGRRQMRRASRGAARGAGGMGIIGLIIGLVMLMGLLGILANLGAAVAAVAPLFALCLVPGAMLVFIGLAARSAQRAKEQREAGAQPAQAQPAASQPVVTQAPQSQAPQSQAPQAARPAAVPPMVPAVSAKPAPQQPVRKPVIEPVRNPADYRERAIGYRRRLQSLIKSRRRGPLSDWMAAILPKLEGWEERVGQLADRLVNFEADKLIQRDIKEVPTNIARMQALWEAEADVAMRAQIERTLGGYKEQQTQLEALTKLMRRTRFVLDDTLASMGTIYSQVQVLDAMDIDSARAAQISEEIQAQVDRLSDVLSAYSDVNQPPVDEIDQAARRIRLEGGAGASR